MAATSANVRSRPGEALTASPVKGGAAQFGLHKKRYTDSGTRWQVVAFRAVRDGDLKVMRELAFEQPGLLHDRFTDAMEDWELEFESPKWYQFRDATCLFIACAYARREAVEFLLEFGADRDDKCYMSQRPIDVVGMCREDDMDESYITTILSRPKQPPCCLSMTWMTARTLPRWSRHGTHRLVSGRQFVPVSTLNWSALRCGEPGSPTRIGFAPRAQCAAKEAS